MAPLFVTLTYGREWPDTRHELKRHLDRFLHRLKRKFPKVAAVWRLELQERGAPHFHLLVFGIGFLSHEWVAQAWYGSIGSTDLAVARAGTQVTRARNWTETRREIAKYVAKQSHLPAGLYLGRHWGVHNRRYLPVSLLVRQIGYGAFLAIRDLCERHLRRCGVDVPNFGPFRGLWAALSERDRALVFDIISGG
jgi:hypothetical protein